MPVFLLTLLLALLPAPSSVAQTTLPASASWETSHLPDIRPVQISLSPDRVERFLSSLPPVVSYARQLDLAQGRVIQPAAEELAFLLLPHLFDPKVENQANALVMEFGFTSYADWANTSHSISLILEASDFTGALDLGGQEQAARREIERNSTLTDEEKARALDELKSQFAALAEFEPLPGNREAAAPYIDRLRAAIGR